jgi:dTDP-4-amino-4,6-dideoxygalactose transaminase
VLSQKLSIFADEMEARNQVAARYSERLEHLVTVPRTPVGLSSVWAQYTVRVPNECNRDAAVVRLKEAGVPTAVYYARGLHHQTAYRDYPAAGNGLPVSECLSGEVLSLPMHPYLDERTQDRIVEALHAVL